MKEHQKNLLQLLIYLKFLNQKNKENSILSKNIKADVSIELQVIEMVARAFNIVEMAPIANFIPWFIYSFDQYDGEEPNMTELMTLLSANIHILPPKEEKHQCLKKDLLNDKEKLEDYEKVESDSYEYNDDDDAVILITFWCA